MKEVEEPEQEEGATNREVCWFLDYRFLLQEQLLCGPIIVQN
jgi:hypothetical protein